MNPTLTRVERGATERLGRVAFPQGARPLNQLNSQNQPTPCGAPQDALAGDWRVTAILVAAASLCASFAAGLVYLAWQIGVLVNDWLNAR